MFQNINGARLASKRVQREFGVNAAIAKEAVAKAGGWRDWHALEATVGTRDAPKKLTGEKLERFLREKAPRIDAFMLMRMIAPEGAHGTREVYDLKKFGPKRSPIAIMTGLPLAPGEDVLTHFPDEVTSIEVSMLPPSLEMDDHSVAGVLNKVAFGFGDRPTLVLSRSDVIHCGGGHPMHRFDPTEANKIPNEHMDMPYGDMCRLLSNNLNMLFAIENVPVAAGFVAVRGEGQTLVQPEPDPDIDVLATRLAQRLASPEAAARLATAVAAHAVNTLEKGRVVREMYDAEFDGHPVMRQRFNPEPWPEAFEIDEYDSAGRRSTRRVERATMTFGDIQGQLSPDTMKDCPAHVMHGDALREVVMNHARSELEALTNGDPAFDDARLGRNDAFWRTWSMWINTTTASLEEMMVVASAHTA